jgi:hypothetical protein
MENGKFDIYRDYFEGYDTDLDVVENQESVRITDFTGVPHVTFEKIPTDRLHVLLGYLRYSICVIKSELSETSCSDKEFKEHKLKWLIKNKKLLTNLMYSNKSEAYSTDEYLVREVQFNTKSPYVCEGSPRQPTVERLHSRKSLHNFPKEIRNYLLQGEYLKIEISNSKASILLAFAQEHLLHVPILGSFVFNKDAVLGVSSDSSGVNEESIEELVNLTIDSFEDSAVSLLFENLFKEISLIRETLWDFHQAGEPQGPNRDETCLRPGGSYDDGKLKHVMQDFYCRAEETTQILSLIHFLEDKHRYQLLLTNSKDMSGLVTPAQSGDTHDFVEVDGITKLPKEQQLSIIPFFDSIYVGSPIESFQSNLGSYIDQFNEHHSHPFLVFKEIPIEPCYNIIKDSELFDRILSINVLLEEISGKDLKILTTKLGMSDLELPSSSLGETAENSISNFYYILCKNMSRFDIKEYSDISEFVNNLEPKQR